MKVILIGANGTVGKNVSKMLLETGHEVIAVGRSSGAFQVNIEDEGSIKELYRKVGKCDALVNASGDVAFAPLDKITSEDWTKSFRSKLLGQINLVQQGIPFISDGGSFSLISGIIGEEQIFAGTVAATVNYALEGYVRAAATELPRGIRINVVSPTVLEDSINTYGSFFPGFKPVGGENVGQAFKKSILGVETGRVFKAR